MDIVTVYPLAKGIRAETLDYYSPHSLPTGTVVSIPIGNRTEQGIVAESQPTNQQRSRVRSADYELKPINHAGTQILLPAFITAAENFAAFSAATTGATIRALTPQPVLTDDDAKAVTKKPQVPDIAAPQPSVIQAKDIQQQAYIESLTAKHTNNGKSVFVCAPTIRDCSQLEKLLAPYNPTVLHSSLTKKKQRKRWKQLTSSSESSVIIATPPFLSVPVMNLARIIVYRESDAAYAMNRRPYLNKELFARYLAETLRIPCTITDTVLPTETLWQRENNKTTDQFPPDFRREDKLKTKLIDMNDHSSDDSSGVRVFGSETVQMIRSAEQNNQHVVLFVARRGRRPFTVCNDCGDILQCNQCGLPLVLTETDNQRKFVCQTCGNTEDSDTRCDNCNSWRLEPLGIGVDFVADILTEHVNETPVFKIDSSSHTSRADQQQTITEFYGESSAILITTKLGISNLKESVDKSAVVTADALLAIPDINISHELFSLLMTLRDKTDDQFIVQTRSSNTDVLKLALSGNIRRFYEKEIEQRKQFNYPPFSYLFKLTIPQHNTQDNLTAQLKEQFSTYSPQIYPARGTNKTMNMLIRTDHTDWIDKNLLDQLRDLPLAVGVDAHPHSLL